MLSQQKQRIARCFSQALPSYDQQAQAQQQINQQMLNLLRQHHLLEFDRLLEIGCGTGRLTQLLQQNLRVKSWHLNDLCDIQPYLQQIFSEQHYQFLAGDAESLAFASGYDLIASASAIQWFEQPLAFVAKAASLLNQKGILLLSSFAPQNLMEIRQLTGVGLNYPDLEQWRAALTPHFEILSLQQQQIQLSFDSPLAVLQHLKQTGVTALSHQHWNKPKLQQFIADYQRHFSLANGKVRCIYQPIFMLARKKEQ